LCTSGGWGKNKRKEGQRVKMMEVFWTHVGKWKNETCGNYSRNGGKGEKRRIMEGVNSVMINCRKFCKCHNVSPLY
jgi:hypothetical protein